MDMQKELERWKSSFKAVQTSEAMAEHKRQFNAFLQSLDPEQGKKFARAFLHEAKEAKKRYDNASIALQLKKTP